MYQTIADFTRDWEYERGMTRKVLDNLTEASLNQPIRPGGRTLGKLAAHIVHTLTEMPGAAGIQVEPAATTAPLAEQYSETAARLGEAVAAQWGSGSLEEEVPIYGEVWTKRKVLSALVKHEIHHRGQMTVLMRQAGLKVPGVYGPAEEEWAAMGLPPME